MSDLSAQVIGFLKVMAFVVFVIIILLPFLILAAKHFG
jgi:hypothetical protein